MKLILLFTTLFLFGKQSTTVYICASPDAKKYHYTKKCRGLNACTHEVKAITLISAKAGGKSLCGWEK